MTKNHINSILFILILLLSSCHMAAWVYYKSRGYGNKRNFKTESQYLEYAQRKNYLPADKILMIDSSQTNDMFSYFEKNNITDYLGAFINDSTEIKKSKYLLAYDNCMMRILGNLDTALHYPPLQLINNDFLKRNTFYRFKGDKRFYFPNDNKIKVFLVYTSHYGRQFGKDYRDIQNFLEMHKDSMESYVITMDYAHN